MTTATSSLIEGIALDLQLTKSLICFVHEICFKRSRESVITVESVQALAALQNDYAHGFLIKYGYLADIIYILRNRVEQSALSLDEIANTKWKGEL